MNQSVAPELFRQDLTTVQMQLAFAAVAEHRTFIRKQKVTYPYHVGRCLQFPDDPEGMTNVYIQSCSGGLFEADHWCSEIAVEAGAAVHLTTSASTVVHRAVEHAAVQVQRFVVEEGAYLEYLPMSTILFPEAQLHNVIEVEIAQGAVVCLFDSFQASTLKDNTDAFTEYRSHIQVRNAERTLIQEKFCIAGEDLSQPMWGFNRDYQCFGNFYMLGEIPHAAQFIAAVNQLSCEGAYLGVNYLAHRDALVIRLMADNAIHLHQLKFKVWSAWRAHYFNKPLLRARK